MHRDGSFSRQAALRRRLTEKVEREREVRPTAPDIGPSTAPRRSKTTRGQNALKFVRALPEAPGELERLALLWQIYLRCLRRVRLQWGHR
jgi:hypothetical protein